MASSWGNSWLTSWANSWGTIVTAGASQVSPPGFGHRKEHKKISRRAWIPHITHEDLQRALEYAVLKVEQKEQPKVVRLQTKAKKEEKRGREATTEGLVREIASKADVLKRFLDLELKFNLATEKEAVKEAIRNKQIIEAAMIKLAEEEEEAALIGIMFAES